MHFRRERRSAFPTRTETPFSQAKRVSPTWFVRIGLGNFHLHLRLLSEQTL